MGRELRDMALDLTPADAGVVADAEDTVYGFVMDTTFDDGEWYTLVCLSEGAVSLYTSATFGVIGAGEHAHIRAAAARVLALIATDLPAFAVTASRDLPPPGMVTLRALTPAGHRCITAYEDDLGEGRHDAAPIFHAAHDVITQIRMIADA